MSYRLEKPETPIQLDSAEDAAFGLLSAPGGKTLVSLGELILEKSTRLSEGLAPLVEETAVVLLGGESYVGDDPSLDRSELKRELLRGLELLKSRGLTHLGLWISENAQGDIDQASEPLLESFLNGGSEPGCDLDTLDLAVYAKRIGLEVICLAPHLTRSEDPGPEEFNERSGRMCELLSHVILTTPEARVLALVSNVDIGSEKLDAPSGTTLHPLAFKLSLVTSERCATVRFCDPMDPRELLHPMAALIGSELPKGARLAPNAGALSESAGGDPFTKSAEYAAFVLGASEGARSVL